ncbi:MAG: VIT1/CCC1 transporter family protein [Candidatus Bipolaricaulia bacterium]
MFESLKGEDFWKIARRYFVLNGFDGILTVLGITAGSYSTGVGNPKVLITSSLGAAIALGVSGVSGAYITEKAERLKEFKELQSNMLSDLERSVHKKNVTQRSIAISVVNGASPFLCALLSTLPYFAALIGISTMEVAYYFSAGIALLLLGLLGAFLGKISRESLVSFGFKMVGVGVLTAVLSLTLGIGG